MTTTNIDDLRRLADWTMMFQLRTVCPSLRRTVDRKTSPTSNNIHKVATLIIAYAQSK